MAKILIVDDSLFARVNLQRLLADTGHEIVEAGDGLEGLDAVASEKPDCILSDLLMPNLDGIGFISALREKSDDTPVIVLTADIQDTKRQQCIGLGVLDFLHKPPKKDELLRLIDLALAEGVEG